MESESMPNPHPAKTGWQHPAKTGWQRLSSRVMTTRQVRSVDEAAIGEFGMHSLVLMENAALGCVSWIVRRFPEPVRTVVLCGPGNNGGDGLVITRHLRLLGWDCRAVLLGPEEKFSQDTRHHATVLSAGPGNGLHIVAPPESDNLDSLMSGAELIIDAMLGTGATGNPRPPMDGWIRAANSWEAFRLAIDIPTGVNADSGQLGQPHFHAHATLTFVSLKPAMLSPEADRVFGSLQILPIGIPDQAIDRILQG
jgi:NAD(P)H-hydrate epimerase